ncbi:capsular polysaccharide export protein, LipB/KpsS family [Halomonas sp. LBP4]|uniref:capsular polysaccharide export protein, LipB/KpsS family n=1 Tax=Halomonas sp. LBP4 TaxID=2044917 RepID=UPI000D7599AB|nr:hypothetical protein [Halomonas sp. LBP4]PXY00351.1 hypothetical protein CR157_06365 [Halomonas sp. LBP4]
MFFRNKSPLDKKALNYIDLKVKFFLSKKHPVGDKYPYEVQDPYKVLGEGTGYENLHLVGDNWIDNPEFPIITVIGCNDWKFGFVADYLPDYRVAFLPRKKVGFSAIRFFLRLKIKPSAALVWGYTETSVLSRYLQLANCPIWRIEDGFVRSAELGASHATPYSLVIDKTGLYYNCHQPSDIENILNFYDFDADAQLLENAEVALSELKALRLSKYNLPTVPGGNNVKLKKRVVVIGQVDADASIRYGNPDGWTSEELVKLAYYENPEAEIVYRPHPEVYKGFQKSAFKKKRVEKFAKLASPEEGVVDFIESADHVYTITSLTGLEALIRGKKVTLVGAPFYSGWGLTDDRVKIERRGRKLSLTELFLAAYIIYPRYLANLSDSFVGLMASCYRISIERDALNKEACKELVFQGDSNDFVRLFHGGSWPLALVEASKRKDYEFDFLLVKNFDHKRHLSFGGGVYNKLLPYIFIGCFSDSRSIDKYLTSVREFLDHELFNIILVDLEGCFPGDYLLKHWVWLLSKSDNEEIFYIENSLYIRYIEECGGEDKQLIRKNVSIDKESPVLNNDLCLAVFETIENKLYDRQFSGLDELFRLLFLSGFSLSKTVKMAVTLSELLFDFSSMRSFSVLLHGLGPFFANRHGALSEFKSFSNRVANSRQEHLRVLSKLVYYRPDSVGAAVFNIQKFEDEFLPHDADIFACQVRLDAFPSGRLAQAYITLENYEKAERIARKVVDLEGGLEGDLVRLSQALSYNGKLGDALSLMKSVRARGLTSMNVAESMRLFVLKGMYAESLDLMKKALSQNINIGEMHRRKAYFGNGMIREAFETFTDIRVRCSVEKYYKEKYYKFDKLLERKEQVFLLAIFGPGDEIRFASIYNRLAGNLGTEKVFISCSPRLRSLFSRSFPALEFVPVARPRYVDKIDLDDYSHVPGSDVINVMDNSAVSQIQCSDKFLFVTDMLHRVLPSKDEFPGLAYLSADPILVEGFQERLKKHKGEILVGVSWRSSLATSARNEHYLSIEQLSKIFDIEGVQFVNFQYDECQEELDWVEGRFPGKLIDFEDVDHYNDFDSVAALMKCMDLIISPATTVAELAGALGCASLMFSNSSEIDWRKKDRKGCDIWHNSMEIVDVKEKGNKDLLVEELRRRLVFRVNFVSSVELVEA